MVQVESSQLASECNNWRDALRKSRDEFTQHKLTLQNAASHSLSKDQLQQVEHLQNQFHIQLINIHDLKHAIKAQCRTIEFELKDAGHLKEETFAKQEELFDQYQNLTTTLHDVRSELDGFLTKA
jgi:hypothetical protein